LDKKSSYFINFTQMEHCFVNCVEIEKQVNFTWPKFAHINSEYFQ
jgi:hypothetical protein